MGSSNICIQSGAHTLKGDAEMKLLGMLFCLMLCHCQLFTLMKLLTIDNTFHAINCVH